MDSNSRSTRLNAPPCVPSTTATTSVNNNNQFLDFGFGANREALLMRNAGLQRQWEKERIREEIMAEEVLRRRDLEREVRRELAMEREFASRSAAEALSTFPVVGNGFDGRMPALPVHTQVGSSETLPFQRSVVPTPILAPPLPDLGNGNAGKVVFLAKPTTSPSVSGTNAQVCSVGDKKFIVTGTKKRLKEWGCALCKVSASSKPALNEHLREKKHRENVAKLKANKSAMKQSRSASWSGKKTCETTTDKKNSGAPKSQNQWYCSPCQVSATSKQNLKDHFRGKGHKAKEAELMANKTTYSPTKNYSIRQKETDKQEAKPIAKGYKNLSNFRCQDCNVTCSSEINLASHLKGKKHIARLEELKQNFASGTSDAAEKGEAHEVTRTEAIENVGREVHALKKVEEETMKALDPIEYESVKNEKNTKVPILELGGKLEEHRKEGLKKKFVFWCEDCQLGLECEPAIASHLKGNKHMARQQVQNKTVATDSFGTNHNNGSSKTRDDSIERHEKTIGIKDGKLVVVGEAKKDVESSDSTAKNEPVGEASKALGNKTDEAIKTANSSQVTSVEREEKECKLASEDHKKTFKFWCKDCQIGCTSENLLNGHFKGKKHIARLEELKQVHFTMSNSLGTSCTAEKRRRKKHTTQLQAKTVKCVGAAASATAGKEDSSEEVFEEALDDLDGEQ